MKHSRRIDCPTCEGKGERPAPELAAGVKICGDCLGQRFLDVNPEPGPHCLVETHEVVGT